MGHNGGEVLLAECERCKKEMCDSNTKTCATYMVDKDKYFSL
jgi:hypothetical protein